MKKTKNKKDKSDILHKKKKKNKNKKNKKNKKNRNSKNKKEKKEKKRSGGRRVTEPLWQVARPPGRPARTRTQPYIGLMSLSRPAPPLLPPSERAPVPRGVPRPALAPAGVGSRTITSRRRPAPWPAAW